MTPGGKAVLESPPQTGVAAMHSPPLEGVAPVGVVPTLSILHGLGFAAFVLSTI